MNRDTDIVNILAKTSVMHKEAEEKKTTHQDKIYYETLIRENRLKEVSEGLNFVEKSFRSFVRDKNAKEYLTILSDIFKIQKIKSRIDDDSIKTAIDLYCSHFKAFNPDFKAPTVRQFRDFYFIFNMSDKDGMKIWTKSPKIIDTIYEFEPKLLLNLIDRMKSDKLDEEEYKKTKFELEVLPIINILDYALMSRNYKMFQAVSKKIEREYLSMYFNMDKEKFKIFVKMYQYESVYLILSRLDYEEAMYFYPDNFDRLVEHLPADTINSLIANDVFPREIVNTSKFLDMYKKLPYEKQVIMLNSMIDVDYSKDLVVKLKGMWNSGEKAVITQDFDEEFEKSMFDKVEKMYREIINSSYYVKNYLEYHPIFMRLEDMFMNHEPTEAFFNSNFDCYGFLLEQYELARKYACESIVNSLYNLDSLESDITYMKDKKYNILFKSRTENYKDGFVDSFNRRNFTSFSILNENNFSHYPGDILFGYYNGVDADSIAHIHPMDALSVSFVKYSKDLTHKQNTLYDIDELNRTTFLNRTYNQITLKTRDKFGKVLKPNALICTDEADLDLYTKEAKNTGLKVLVLKKNKQTIECNRDIYEDLK